MHRRPPRLLWAVLLPLFVGTAQASLLSDAKSLVTTLQGLGDYGRATATTAIDNARGTCQSSLSSTTAGVNRLAAIRAENDQLAASLPSGATAINLPDAATMESARLALDAAGSAWSTAVQTTSIAATTATALARSGDEAVSALRALIPSPFGTRPATVRGKCTVPGTNTTIDCDLPNGPPSDNEFRTAIARGQSVTAGVAGIGATALDAYYRVVMSAQKDWTTRYSTYANLLAKQRMSLEQARLTKLHATPTVVPATPAREAIRVRK